MYDQNHKVIDRREQLRVKVKSLAAEARIIRQEERRYTGVLRNELWEHRTKVVRFHARNAHVAYGIIRGLTIDQIEPVRHTDPNWDEVTRMVRKYGSLEFRKWEHAPTEAQQLQAA
jgi:hypothetical protein